jgi:hypothetical protein
MRGLLYIMLRHQRHRQFNGFQQIVQLLAVLFDG